MHWQGCVGYSKNVRHQKLRKQFPGCHITLSKNAFAAYRYCGKPESRAEEHAELAFEFGAPPAARNVKGDTKARNQMLLSTPLVSLIEEG